MSVDLREEWMMLLARLALLAACSLLPVRTETVSAQESRWQAGVAERKITPESPIYLAGYASRNKPFESVADDLYVKALALQDARGERAVLITSDLIGFRAQFAEPICQRISEKTGLERGQILLNSSHTHTGPLLTLDSEPRGRDMTAEQAKDTVAYTRRLTDEVVAAACESLSKLEPAKLSYGRGVAKFVMNRREPTPDGVRLGVNPTGLADRAVPVLRVDSTDGTLRAVLFGAACHNTTLTGRHYMVSGDYAGLAQQFIEKQHPGVQAMFMLGCAGSANPYPRGTMEHARAHGEELGGEVCRVLETKLRPVAGPLKTAFARIDLALRPIERAEIDRLLSGRSGWQPWAARRMLKLLERGDDLPKHYTAPLAVWQFGDDLTLVGLPGEVVVDYVPLIEKALGPLELWIAAYCNDVFGYLPSAEVLREGGYETRGLIYGGVGFFSPKAQDVLVSKVRQLAEQAGRK